MKIRELACGAPDKSDSALVCPPWRGRGGGGAAWPLRRACKTISREARCGGGPLRWRDRFFNTYVSALFRSINNLAVRKSQAAAALGWARSLAHARGRNFTSKRYRRPPASRAPRVHLSRDSPAAARLTCGHLWELVNERLVKIKSTGCHSVWRSSFFTINQIDRKSVANSQGVACFLESCFSRNRGLYFFCVKAKDVVPLPTLCRF